MWRQFENGETIGRPGFCGGVIVRDECHAPNIRVILERDCDDDPWFVLCQIEGIWAYVRPVESEEEAKFNAVLEALTTISKLVPCDEDDAKMGRLQRELDQFEERFA